MAIVQIMGVIMLNHRINSVQTCKRQGQIDSFYSDLPIQWDFAQSVVKTWYPRYNMGNDKGGT